MIFTKPQLVLIVEAEALKQKFDPALVCSVVDVVSEWHPERVIPQESLAFNPALSYNPAENHIVSSSIGLMQFTGLQARQLGYSKHNIEDLTQPELNVEIGIKLLLMALDSTSRRLEMYSYKIATLIPKIVSKIKPYEEFLASPARPVFQ